MQVPQTTKQPIALQHLPDRIRVVERSWLARLAALKMKAPAVALVLGKTIYLHGMSRHDLVSNPRMLRHELKHVEQYQRLGTARFVVLYLWNWLRVGYYHNPLEIEARQAEKG
jgi:hypothetical protein